MTTSTEELAARIDERITEARDEMARLDAARLTLVSTPPDDATEGAAVKFARKLRKSGIVAPDAPKTTPKTTRADQVLRVLKGRGPLTGAEVATAIGITAQHAYGELSKLKKAERVTQVGDRKWGIAE